MILETTVLKGVVVKTVSLPAPMPDGAEFQTTIIGGVSGGEQWFHPTRERARKGHETAVAYVRLTSG